MPPPNTPNEKVPWINRQLHKIGNKLHKKHSEGKKNEVKENSSSEQSENDSVRREIGFNAFKGHSEKDEARARVVELPAKVVVEPSKLPTPPPPPPPTNGLAITPAFMNNVHPGAALGSNPHIKPFGSCF